MLAQMRKLIVEIENGDGDLLLEDVTFVQNIKVCLENDRYRATKGQLEHLKSIKAPKKMKNPSKYMKKKLKKT